MTTLLPDPLQVASLDDPYDGYARLRTSPSLAFDPGTNSWVASRYADVRLVLEDAEHFSSQFAETSDPARTSPQNCDGPFHAELRGLLARVLRGVDTVALVDEISDFVSDMIAQLPRCESVDWAAYVARPLAARMTQLLLSMPMDSGDWLCEVAAAVVAGMDGDRRPEVALEAARAKARANERITQWSDAKGTCTTLARVFDQGRERGIPDATLVNCVRTLMLSTFASPSFLNTSWIANLTGAGHPVRCDWPDDLAAMNEFVRYDSPVQGESRIVREPVWLHDVQLNPGDTVIALIASANRDDVEFEFANELQLTRPHNPHLSFGVGRHSCLGRALVELQLRALWDAVRTSQVQIFPTGENSRNVSATLRGYSSFSVVIR